MSQEMGKTADNTSVVDGDISLHASSGVSDVIVPEHVTAPRSSADRQTGGTNERRPSMTNLPGTAGPASSAESMASTIAAVVEKQLTQYLASVTKQVEGVRESAGHTIAALQSEMERRLEALGSRLDIAQTSNETFRQTITVALEEQLSEYAETMQARLDDLDRRLRLIPAGAVDATELAALREQLEGQLGMAHGRIDDLHKATRRFDEQAAAMVQHVNDTTLALTQRMDASSQALASAVEERLGLVRTALESVGPNIQRQLSEQTTAIAQRLELADNSVTDRMLALEERINDTQGTRIAQLEATVGRIGSGFDESIGAMSHRLLELDNKLAEYDASLAEFDQRLGGIDQDGIEQLKEQMTSAVGEATIVRIELDRAMADTGEKLDKANLRMAEIEGMLSNEMDVNASVQLERLEEIERALAELDPEKFAPSPVVRQAAAPAAAVTPPAPVPTFAAAEPSAPATPAPPTAPAAQAAVSVANQPLTLPASWGVEAVEPAAPAPAPAPAPPPTPKLSEKVAAKSGGKGAGPLSARLSAAGQMSAPEPAPEPAWPAVPSTELDPRLPGQPARGDASPGPNDDTPAG